MPFECGSCCKCEDQLLGSLYPGEEWKLKFFKSCAFRLEGVWFFHPCPHFKDENCSVHDADWRPLQCQMYPCYINYEGNVEVDYDLCPNAKQVDEQFKNRVKQMYLQLSLTLEELGRWGRVVSKYCEPAKCRIQLVHRKQSL